MASFWSRHVRSSAQTRIETSPLRRAEVIRQRGATTAPAANPGVRELGIENPHPLIASLWATVVDSCEVVFYSEADWQRLRLEL